MKQIFLFLFCALGSQYMVHAQTSKLIPIETKRTVLLYSVGADQKLYQSYLGVRLLQPAEYTSLGTKNFEAYLTAGTSNLFEPAIRAVHADNNPSLDLQYVSDEQTKLDDNTTLTSIKLKDPQYPFEVVLNFKANYKEDVIEEWTEIKHNEKKAVKLYNYASSMLHFDAKEYWLSQFHGNWAKEMRMQESKLTSGIKIIDSKLGTRADMYQTPVFFLSLNTPSDETNGEMIAGALEWSGNFQFTFEVDEQNSLRVISGINPYASDYVLQPGKVFTTPSFIFTYTNLGKGEASRNLHNWARKNGIVDGDKSRYTLLNNWETTGFNFDESKLNGLFDDAQKLGVDLFLLDDGWFGNKYPRANDRAGLGDWQETTSKLPNGISALTKSAEQKGLKFGIWLEPEMVNPKSELYEKHPEWILKLPNRPEKYYRNQLVLDLSNPQVQDFVYGIVDHMLTAHPSVAFIKWDCNSVIYNAYSPYLKDNQSQLYVDYVNGLYKVMARVREKYPHLPIMLCSGGGGRVDYGAMKYFTEFWPSDNTDALERVYIQWGYSYFYPSIAMCNHITSWGTQSLKFRTDVAMMGKMGYDIQVNKMTDSELKFSQEAIANYKRLSDVIWHGELYRLISPYDENRSVLMYVNENKSKAVLFSYTLNLRYGDTFKNVRLQGLDPQKKYQIKEINVVAKPVFKSTGKSYSGDYLMKIGLNVSSVQSLSSVVLEITEE
ncbi:MAG: alpha-galactosidase [Bacteroidota bacterium]|nr:alpha-galactosidase [Bacteroidota bacterium]